MINGHHNGGWQVRLTCGYGKKTHQRGGIRAARYGQHHSCGGTEAHKAAEQPRRFFWRDRQIVADYAAHWARFFSRSTACRIAGEALGYFLMTSP